MTFPCRRRFTLSPTDFVRPHVWVRPLRRLMFDFGALQISCSRGRISRSVPEHRSTSWKASGCESHIHRRGYTHNLAACIRYHLPDFCLLNGSTAAAHPGCAARHRQLVIWSGVCVAP